MKYTIDGEVMSSSLFIKSNVELLDGLLDKVYEYFNDTWYGELDEAEYDKILDHLNNHLIIELSSEKKKKKYEGLSIDKIIDLVDKLVEKFPFLKELIKIREILEIEKHNMESMQGQYDDSTLIHRLVETLKDLKATIEESDIDDEAKKELKEAIKKIKNREHIGLVLGEYIHHLTEPRIILYCFNIEKGRFGEEEMYESVFAHECFHAIHYAIKYYFSKNNLDNINHIITIESLASYFEAQYCSSWLNKDMANEIIESWEAYDVRTYPYSGAREFFWPEDFFRVFNASIPKEDEYILEYCVLNNNPIDNEKGYIVFLQECGIRSYKVYCSAVRKVLKLFEIDNVNILLYSLSRDFRDKFNYFTPDDNIAQIVLAYIKEIDLYRAENKKSSGKLSAAISRLIDYIEYFIEYYE